MEFGPTGALDICHHSSGYVQVSNTQAAPTYEWRYRITDHLGNTRALFTDRNADGLIRQSTDAILMSQIPQSMLLTRMGNC
jgi:hypothetical protein